MAPSGQGDAIDDLKKALDQDHKERKGFAERVRESRSPPTTPPMEDAAPDPRMDPARIARDVKKAKDRNKTLKARQVLLERHAAKKSGKPKAPPADDVGILAADAGPDPLAGLGVTAPGPDANTQARTHSTLQELAAQVFQEKQLADSLFDPADIELKTRLNPQLTVHMATAILVAQEHGIPELAAYVYKLMELRVSLLGEGRKEVVEVTKGLASQLHPDAVSRMRG